MKVGNYYAIVGEPEVKNNNLTKGKRWFINQCGYDVGKSKRATLVNGNRGDAFFIKNEVGKTVYFGTIRNQIADFSDFDTEGTYTLVCGDAVSYDFVIAQDRTSLLSIPLALKFMEMSRQDAFDVGASTGYAWRDSHQFSFELNGLAFMYLSCPEYFKSMPQDVYRVSDCEYADLRVQNEPNIIWLMKFGARRYIELLKSGVKIHALIKGQLACFLYIYPYIQEYVSKEFYEEVRTKTIDCWAESDCTKQWYNLSNENNNMYLTQNQIGTVKGMLPVGYAVIPNLLMYEVCGRDGIPNSDFLSAFTKNMNWLVNQVDLTDPRYTKGQRMNEYIGVQALTYPYEHNKDLCPPNTIDKIKGLADVFIRRSVNLWDYRQYKSMNVDGESIWINLEKSGGLCNNPYAGFMGECFMLSRCIDDSRYKKKLEMLAMANIAHVYGRNPMGRHMSYRGVSEFGAKLGWVTQHAGGYGNLSYCTGKLDGSPKEEVYPYLDSTSYNGYTEGWVAFNSAWNMGLAYLLGEKQCGIDIFNQGYQPPDVPEVPETPVETWDYEVQFPITSSRDQASITGTHSIVKGKTYRYKFDYKIDATNATAGSRVVFYNWSAGLSTSNSMFYTPGQVSTGSIDVTAKANQNTNNPIGFDDVNDSAVGGYVTIYIKNLSITEVM